MNNSSDKKIAVIKPYHGVLVTPLVFKSIFYKNIKDAIWKIFNNILRKYEAEILKRTIFCVLKNCKHITISCFYKPTENILPLCFDANDIFARSYQFVCVISVWLQHYHPGDTKRL